MTDKTELEVTAADERIAREVMADWLGLSVDECGANSRGALLIQEGIRRSRLATRTPDPTPVAWMYECGKSRIVKENDDLGLSGYTKAPLYAHPPAVPADGLVEALTEIERRTGLLIHHNVGRWSAKVEHDLRTMDVLSVNQSIARTALAAHRGEA